MTLSFSPGGGVCPSFFLEPQPGRSEAGGPKDDPNPCRNQKITLKINSALFDCRADNYLFVALNNNRYYILIDIIYY